MPSNSDQMLIVRHCGRAPHRGIDPPHPGLDPGSSALIDFFMFFFSVPPEKKEPKRELVARFRLDKMSSLRSVLRDSLRSNKSSHRLRRRTQSSHFIANLLAIATLPPPTPPRERDLLSFDL